MSSLYADYLSERTEDKIIELPQGFATYRILNGKQVYLIDLYVKPDHRRDYVATELSHMVMTEAKKLGCTELLGTVVPSSKNSTASVKVLLAHGMTLQSASNDLIVFKKDIK